jgi:hypothetical protein
VRPTPEHRLHRPQLVQQAGCAASTTA